MRNIMVNIRLCIYAALFVGAIAFFMRYDYLSNRVKEQDATIQKFSAAYEEAKKQIKDADIARTEYLNKLEASKNEIDTLRNSVNAGATGLRVKASCPKQTAIAYTAGTKAAAPELDRAAEQDYYALLEGIRAVEARYSLCIKTLEDERK